MLIPIQEEHTINEDIREHGRVAAELLLEKILIYIGFQWNMQLHAL